MDNGYSYFIGIISFSGKEKSFSKSWYSDKNVILYNEYMIASHRFYLNRLTGNFISPILSYFCPKL